MSSPEELYNLFGSLTVPDLRNACRGLEGYSLYLRKHEMVELLVSIHANPQEASRLKYAADKAADRCQKVRDEKARRDVQIHAQKEAKQRAAPTEQGDWVAGRAAKRRMTDYVHQEYQDDITEFLELPSTSEFDNCMESVLKRMGNTAVEQAVCIVCAREVFRKAS